MTEDHIIEDVFRKEGDRYGDRTTKPPIDQPTGRGGITLPVLQEYFTEHLKKVDRPASIEDLKAMDHAQAVHVVRWKLRQLAKRHGFDQITFEPLRLQMVDYAYNSGPALATRWLQRVLRVERTSRMDVATRTALGTSDQWLVHQALIAARLQMIDRATDTATVDKSFEEGLESRALTFSLLTVP